jgi:membrane-associated phospholipid phosphatase
MTLFILAILFVAYYPFIIAVTFLVFWLVTKIPARNRFLSRALTALVIAVFLAHVNRIFGFWPEHLLFPSGHTTFCAGLSWSLAMLRPKTLAVTIPLLALLGAALVLLHLHTTFDVMGAFPLVLIIYGLLHTWWRLPGDVPPLDRAGVSP